MTLKEAREQCKLSQNDLSKVSGIPLRTIRSYENEEEKLCNAWIGNVLKLTKVLNITVSDLVPVERYQDEVLELITEWDNRIEQQPFDDIYKRYFNKIYRWLKREQITHVEYDQLIKNLKNKKFDYVSKVQNDGYLESDVTQIYIEDLNQIIIEYSPIIVKREEENSSVVNFKRIRLLRDVSLEKLEFCTGKKKQTFKNYESEQRNINSMSVCMAIKVAIVLRCGIEDIFVLE